MQRPDAPCFLCGERNYSHWAKAKDVEYFTTEEYFDYYECESCKLLRIDPVPADKLGIIYPSNYYSFTSGKKSIVYKIKEAQDKALFRKMMGRLQGDDLKVLDVGGGSGWLLDVIRSISDKITTTQVVDIDQDAEKAALANGHKYFCGRIEDFETTERFDFVLLLNLIEHVDDPLAVLKKIESILTPQGIVLIKTPNYQSLDARLFRKRNWGGLHCPRHWVIFSKQSFALMAQRSGFRIDTFSYTQGAPFWTVSVLAWMQRKKLIRINSERPAFRHPLFPVLLGLFAGFDMLRKPFAKTSQMFIVLAKSA